MFNSRKRIFKISLMVILTAFSVWATACANPASNTDSNAANQNVSPKNANSVKDNTEELGTIIELPELPDEAVWREEETADPKGKKLTAVLKYNPESAAKIIASAEKNKFSAQVEIGAENWFPDELIAQSQLSGNESIKGTVYNADGFFNATYKNGKISRVNDTNYFVLELTTY